MGSPRTYLYDQLLQNQDIIKRHMMPALRKAGYFNPITQYMEQKFFTFANDSFDIDTIDIPYDFTMRKIFRVKYAMKFNLQQYIEYLIVQRKSRFVLTLYPDLRVRLILADRFPAVFIGTHARTFQRAVEPIIPKILAFNPKVLDYAFKAMKVRLDRTGGFRCSFAPNGEIDIIPNNPHQFIFQLLAGKIDIFGRQRPNPSFQIQSINKEFVRQRGFTSYLIYFLIFYHLFSLFRRQPTVMDLENAMRDLRTGKLKLKDL